MNIAIAAQRSDRRRSRKSFWLPRKTANPPLAADYGTDVHFDNALTHTASTTGNSRGSRILWKMGKYKIFPGPEQPISEPGEVAIPIVNQIVSGKSGKCNAQLLQTFRRLVQVRMPWRSPFVGANG